MEALEYLLELFLFKRAARVRYRNELTAVHFAEAERYLSSIAVLDGVLNEILQSFRETVGVAEEQAVIEVSDGEFGAAVAAPHTVLCAVLP